jgi:hypothetical protein
MASASSVPRDRASAVIRSAARPARSERQAVVAMPAISAVVRPAATSGTLALTTRTNSAVPPPPDVPVEVRDADRVAVAVAREELADDDGGAWAVAVTVTVATGSEADAAEDAAADADDDPDVSPEQAARDATSAAPAREARTRGVPDMASTLRNALLDPQKFLDP